MEMIFYRNVDGAKISMRILRNMLYVHDNYNDFNLEIDLAGVKYLVDALKHIRYYSDDLRSVKLGQIIRTKLGYPRCWSNIFVIARANSILDMLTNISNLEIDKDKLDKLNIGNLKYIEYKLPSGVKKVDGKTLISLFSID